MPEKVALSLDEKLGRRPPSTAVRLMSRYVETGSVEPARQGRPKGSGKLGPHRDFITRRVKARPDITMPELAAVLEEECGVCLRASDLPVETALRGRVHL